MTVRQKLQARLDILETQLKAEEHLQSIESLIAVIATIASVSKFLRIMNEEERDFLNAAQMAVEERLEWK